MDCIIQVDNLAKSYGKTKAVDNISFKVEKSELFSLLGVNGAGKSTTINILCSILQKDSGSVFIAGNDLDKNNQEIKKKIGIVFQGSVLDKKLSVKENLASRGAYYGLYGAKLKTQLDFVAQKLELHDIFKRAYGKLSGGQRRRVDIARALINQPEILFLDEPTTGLDPQTRKTVWEVIHSLRKELGLTVFLTTHYMEETANADHVVIMDAGKVMVADTPNALKEQYTHNYIKLYKEKCLEVDEILNGQNLKVCYEHNAYKIGASNSMEAIKLINSTPILQGDFEIIKGDMDDVFLAVTGKKLEA